jgi:hypothetical protein
MIQLMESIGIGRQDFPGAADFAAGAALLVTIRYYGS